jgi:hypothetical protein
MGASDPIYESARSQVRNGFPVMNTTGMRAPLVKRRSSCTFSSDESVWPTTTTSNSSPDPSCRLKSDSRNYCELIRRCNLYKRAHIEASDAPALGLTSAFHAVWDSGLVEHTGRSEAEYVSYLEKIIRDRHLVASGTSTDWSNESHDLARGLAIGKRIGG